MSEIIASGHLAKMLTNLGDNPDDVVEYTLPMGEARVPMNQYIGQHIRLSYQGQINCTHCGRKTKKSFSQGFCFPCMQSLARCDSCIMSPEKCHYDNGTCREPAWADEFCMTDHIVYLSNASAPKVGITRVNQMPTRWIDQGAIQALPIFRVTTRQHSGFVEDALKAFIADKTNWRTMLKGQAPAVDLKAVAESLKAEAAEDLDFFVENYGFQALQSIDDVDVLTINYPVQTYPEKVSTHNFDKEPVVEGLLQGIKGQYLILDTGVINIRKFTAYDVAFSLVEV